MGAHTRRTLPEKLRHLSENLDSGLYETEVAIVAEAATEIDRLTRLVYELETRCDPTGDTQTIASQREQIGGLVAMIEERIEKIEAGTTRNADRIRAIANGLTAETTLRVDYVRAIETAGDPGSWAPKSEGKS
jgi:hypothetical protein